MSLLKERKRAEWVAMGVNARKAGKARTDNPLSGQQRGWWEIGWIAMDNEVYYGRPNTTANDLLPDYGLPLVQE